MRYLIIILFLSSCQKAEQPVCKQLEYTTNTHCVLDSGGSFDNNLVTGSRACDHNLDTVVMDTSYSYRQGNASYYERRTCRKY